MGQDAVAQEVNTIDEIVVTARRREESLQEIPVSVTAFSAGDLAARRVDNISQVAPFTPNMEFDNTAPVSGSSIGSTVFIRGIGQTDFTLNSDPGVGIYVDGVYIARSIGGLIDLLDIERVEVLRGPQGTLFGKNTVGGALNITSREPSTEAVGFIDFRAGRYDRTDLRAGFDAPITDKLLTNFSAAFLKQDGYQERVLLNDSEDLGNVDRVIARGRALWLPTDNFKLDVAADYTRGREQSTAQSILAIEPATGAPFIAAANGDIPGTIPTLDPQFASQFPNARYDDSWISSDPFQTFQTSLSRSDFDIFGASLTLTWDFGAASIKSITAYRDLESEFARDADGSPFLVVGTEDIYDQEQFSQELQLYGASSGGRFSWVTGFFYLDEEGVNQNLVPTSIGDLNSGGAIDNTTWAVFGHVSFDFTDRFGGTLGVRFTDETKGFTPGFPPPQEQFFGSNANGLALGLPPMLPLLLVADNEADSDNTDVTASLQYSFTQELLTYASYSTGHKSGGFSQRIGPSPLSPLPVPPSFQTEEVTVYELGVKWIGWGNRLRINTAAFFTDYDDIQITPLFEGIGPVTRNAGEAEIQGAEFEWLLLPGPNWEWSGGIGWLETEYTKLSPESQVNLNLDGTPVLTLNTELANSPEWSINSSVAYTWDVSASGVIKFRIDWTYTDELFNDVLNAVELKRDAVNLVGASIVYQTKDGNWEVSLNGRNLADETYLISGNAERYVGNIGYTQGVYARPRDWWVGLRRNF